MNIFRLGVLSSKIKLDPSIVHFTFLMSELVYPKDRVSLQNDLPDSPHVSSSRVDTDSLVVAIIVSFEFGQFELVFASSVRI
jgi:hypothetical protein